LGGFQARANQANIGERIKNEIGKIVGVPMVGGRKDVLVNRRKDVLVIRGKDVIVSSKG